MANAEKKMHKTSTANESRCRYNEYIGSSFETAEKQKNTSQIHWHRPRHIRMCFLHFPRIHLDACIYPSRLKGSLRLDRGRSRFAAQLGPGLGQRALTGAFSPHPLYAVWHSSTFFCKLRGCYLPRRMRDSVIPHLVSEQAPEEQSVLLISEVDHSRKPEQWWLT